MGIISAFPGKSKPKLQSKTVTPSTSQQNVTADSGYDGLDKVTVKAVSGVTQATPSISVSSGGLITASATQSAGYVSAGTKSSTKQLTAQAAKTWTPSTKDQTIPSGTYLTGQQTIQGDPDLLAANIKSGVSIFGVTGNLKTSQVFSVALSGSSPLTISGVDNSITSPTVLIYNDTQSLNDLHSFISTAVDYQCILAMRYKYGATSYFASTFYYDATTNLDMVWHSNYASSYNDGGIEFSYSNGTITLTCKARSQFFWGKYTVVVY